jgi:hypothetical protein
LPPYIGLRPDCQGAGHCGFLIAADNRRANQLLSIINSERILQFQSHVEKLSPLRRRNPSELGQEI